MTGLISCKAILNCSKKNSDSPGVFSWAVLKFQTQLLLLIQNVLHLLQHRDNPFLRRVGCVDSGLTKFILQVVEFLPR